MYTVSLPAGTVGVIFNGGDGPQTVDITDFFCTGYYPNGNKVGEKYDVAGWSD